MTMQSTNILPEEAEVLLVAAVDCGRGTTGGAAGGPDATKQTKNNDTFAKYAHTHLSKSKHRQHNTGLHWLTKSFHH